MEGGLRIAIDYDGTVTRDPELWRRFIHMAKVAGHEVVCVTSRFADDPVQITCDVIYTGMQPKGQLMALMDKAPDIWIDDHPERIFR